MTATLDIADRIAIQDLITEFHWCIDHGRANPLGSLLHEDVEIMLPDRTIRGRETVVSFFEEALQRRSAVVRHTWNNLRIETVTPDRVVLSFTQSSRRNPPDQQYHGDGDVEDVVVRVNGAWRFLRRVNRPVFQPEQMTSDHAGGQLA